MNEIEALLQLTGTPHLGSMKIRLLIQHYGSAKAALEANPLELLEFPGFGPKVVESLQKHRAQAMGKQEWDLAARYGVTIVPYNSPNYPKRLLDIPDYPVVLYIKGDWKECDQQSIAVVGTRNMSIYGGEMAEKISYDLAGCGFTVISGLARGIDTAAHRGALRRGRTVAVIGSGLADIYPTENISLCEEISRQGAVMSEFPMRTPPDRQNFPQRNRIVSGLTLGTLLIEAPRKSGAMITMDKALSQDRKLFALPGRADNENFQGNHYLIKKGLAHLIENAQDIIDSYGDLFQGKSLMRPKGAPSGVLLEAEEVRFLGLLPQQEVAFDEIAYLTKLPIAKLNVLIMSLIMKKAIKEFPGKLYKKIST